MTSRQGIATDQLINVIQVLQLGRKTGELQAERQVGSQIEEGMLKFVHGQITFAQCGHLDGQAALHWLQSWGQCRFVFDNVVVKKDTGPLLHTRQPSSQLPNTQKPQDSTSRSYIQQRQDSTRLPSIPQRQDSGNLPGIPQRQDSAKLPVQYVPVQYSPGQQYSPGIQYSPRTEPISAYAAVIPRRMYAADEGMYRLTQANISRLHRHLYLLIDGQRSCAELVRLVNRQPEEVIQLLKDLERVGIIQLN